MRSGKVFVLAVVICFFQQTPVAFAMCETSPGAAPAMLTLEATAKKYISDWDIQEENFIDELINKQAVFEVKYRIHSFEHNITDALSKWGDKFIKALKDMTKQISVANMDQVVAAA